MCDEIDRLRPDVILVFLGTPEQDYWIDVASAGLPRGGARLGWGGGRFLRRPREDRAQRGSGILVSSGCIVCSAGTSAGCGNGTPTTIWPSSWRSFCNSPGFDVTP